MIAGMPKWGSVTSCYFEVNRDDLPPKRSRSWPSFRRTGRCTVSKATETVAECVPHHVRLPMCQLGLHRAIPSPARLSYHQLLKPSHLQPATLIITTTHHHNGPCQCSFDMVTGLNSKYNHLGLQRCHARCNQRQCPTSGPHLLREVRRNARNVSRDQQEDGRPHHQSLRAQTRKVHESTDWVLCK